MRPFLTLGLMATALLSCTLTASANEPVNGSKPTDPKAGEASVVSTPPHCEVPCGIYADQRRFEEMLEDTDTIAKAIASVEGIRVDMQTQPLSAKSLNQLVRWVNTKESHATNIQHIASQYFLTQRIKADSERYEAQLKAAHAVIVSSMKCKQDADPATAETLRAAILDLYRAYEGKEPELHKADGK